MFAPLLSIALLAAPLEPVSYPSGAETVKGLLALPPGTGRHPALILVHEWWGLNDFAKRKAESFAAQGYVTLAIDLYRGPVATDPDTAHQLARGLPEDRAKRDLAAAFAYLAARPDVDPKHIGSIGWCMGGGYALEVALQEPRLAAAAIYYGRLPTDPAAIARIKAKLIGNYGTEDRGIPPEAVQAFAEQAKKAGVSADFKEYPGAGHGFASSADVTVFRPDAAKDADARTDAFLRQALAPDAAKKGTKPSITGAHVILYSKDADKDRDFIRDVLKFPHVDAGHGWLIFALPPSEVAVHPAEENDAHEFYLLCDDVKQFIADMKKQKVACSAIEEQRWGSLTHLRLPGGGKLGVYQPKHPQPKHRKS